MSRLLAVAAFAVAAFTVAACGASASAPTPSPGGFISVYGAWARPAPKGSDSAAYLTITNGRLADDTLVGASTPAAASAQVHQTTTESGMTGMHRADAVRIPAGRDLVLEPGGYHVMLTGLTQDLTAGGTFPLTLTFEQTGPVTVVVDVKAG